MSVLQYNDVVLPYVFHTGFRQEVIYDDLGGTDWQCTRFNIEAQAVLNSDYLNLIYPPLVGKTTNPAVIMKAIRTALLQPRRELTLTFNDVNLLPVPAPGLLGTVDARNGPQPQYCAINQLTSTTFLVTFGIVAHYWECNTVNPDGNPIVSNATGNNVLFNRWNESVEIDGANFSKRIREGKFVIRSDNPDAKIADEIRSQMAVVGVPQGFLRESVSYTVSPDGLAIQYRIVDREVLKNPPFPAFEASGSYAESSPLMGPIRYLECNLRLRGKKSTPQAQLVALATAVVTSKISVNAQILNPVSRAIPQQYGIRVDMYDNVVECHARSMVTATRARTNNIAVNLARTVFTPGSDPIPGELVDPPQPGVIIGQPAVTPAYTDRGTASILLQAAAYYDPCLRNTIVNKATGQFNTLGLEVGEAGVHAE